MATEAKILIGWLLFGGTHVLGSSVRVRTALTRAVGLKGFKALYSLVALATFIPLCYVFFTDRHAGAVLYSRSPALQHVTEALMFVVFVVLVQGLITPSPLTTLAELSGRYPREARGIQRVTRHPVNAAFALFGIAHCISNPTVGDWLFFGGFTVYALVSAIHQDRRTLATTPDKVREFHERTSLVPFSAILTGKQRLALAEYGRTGLVVALALAIVLRIFHGRIFGGFA